jgi:hypothetical protein
MIVKISLKNFQGFRTLQQFDVSSVNLVFGANSTGKTSIQRALRLFASSVPLGAPSTHQADSRKPYGAREENGFIFDQGLEAKGLTLEAAKNSLSANNSNEPMFIELVLRSRYEWNSGNEQIDFTNLHAWDAVTDKFDFPFFRIRVTDEIINGQNQSFFEPLDHEGKSPWKIVGGNIEADPMHWWWQAFFGESWTVRKVEYLSWRGIRQSQNLPTWDDFVTRSILEETRRARQLSEEQANFLIWHAYLDSALCMLREFSLFELDPNRPTIDTIDASLDQKFKDLRKARNMGYSADPTEKDPLTIQLPEDRLKLVEQVLFGGVDIESVKEDFLELTNDRYVPVLRESLESKDFQIMQKRDLDFGVFDVKFVFDRFTGSLQRFQNVGDGLSSVLPILEQLNRVSQDFVYIPQPETHLHPKMQGKLMKIILNRAYSNHIQVFIETHSENMLLSMQKEIRNGRASKNDVSIVYTESAKLEDDFGASDLFYFTPAETKVQMPFEDLVRGENYAYNISLDKAGELIDPFPESFADMRASYLFDLEENTDK